MKILVIFTGGTIGSAVSGKVISPKNESKRLLLEMYKEKYGDDVDFEISEPYYALSENNTGITISRLMDAVLSEIDKNYYGIIVTHGTDTLQYSAAALSYALGSSSVAVMCVSSNYVLTDERANGLDNFAAAVDFIKGGFGRGVFVPYKNSDGKIYVHRASRLIQHNEFSDDVFSVKNQHFGSFIGGDFIKNPDYSAEKDALAPFGKIKLSQFSSEIKVIQAYPGCEYPRLDEKTKAVLIRTYHSGTVCTDNESFAQFADECKEKNMPCLICGAENRDIYESAKVFDEYGFAVLPPASFVSQYMKLWLCVSSGIDFKEICSKSLGEDILMQ